MRYVNLAMSTSVISCADIIGYAVWGEFIFILCIWVHGVYLVCDLYGTLKLVFVSFGTLLLIYMNFGCVQTICFYLSGCIM